MIFVLPIFLLGGLILIGLWWFFFRAAVRHEGAIRAAKERATNFDRLLLTPGEALYCLDCRSVFPGPLEDSGCPKCHVRAFVIPARAHSEPLAAPAGGEAQAAQGPIPPMAPLESNDVPETRQTPRNQ